MKHHKWHQSTNWQWWFNSGVPIRFLLLLTKQVWLWHLLCNLGL